MRNIETGEFYRTRNGKIHKWSKGRTYIGNDEILKHSKNIIDLLEVGDYVNGYRILEIHEALAPDDERILDIGYGMAIFIEEIDSIVTKEAFLNAEYRVEAD